MVIFLPQLPVSHSITKAGLELMMMLLPQLLMSHSMAKAGFELMVILLPQPTMCWNHRCKLLYLAFLMLESSANKTVRTRQISLVIHVYMYTVPMLERHSGFSFCRVLRVYSTQKKRVAFNISKMLGPEGEVGSAFYFICVRAHASVLVKVRRQFSQSPVWILGM